MQIGERIRWLRKQRNMTTENLANKVGLTRQTISRYETGAIQDIPRSKIVKIATALDVSEDYLIGYTLESQLDSYKFDIQRQREALKLATDVDERTDIELNIGLLEDAYDSTLYLVKHQNISATPNEISQQRKKRCTGPIGMECLPAKKVKLTMDIDYWMLLLLKGMAADSERSITDEIEAALYAYVMAAIEEDVNKEYPALSSEYASLSSSENKLSVQGGD